MMKKIVYLPTRKKILDSVSLCVWDFRKKKIPYTLHTKVNKYSKFF